MTNLPCWIVLLLAPLAADDNLRCLDEDVDGHAVFYSHLQQQAYDALDERLKRLEDLTTREKIGAYQERQKAFFRKQLGGFPERTPLNAKVVGKLSGDGCRIEKIIFESQPDHHVTAALYLPLEKGPYPGVVVSSGHSRTAKAAEYNQRYGVALARNGMAALCYDPIGQGERSQILTPQGVARHSSTTREHFLVGVGSTLVGANTARYRVWDGMRAIDYLTSRPDIIADKIGFTGCSGGGTLTSYVMALDDRVKCAAPSCYLTTFRRLIETIGPQDAEQNIFAQIEFGMDQPDYILMRAPQPTLISATTGDFFDIEGTWTNFRQAKRIYTRLSAPQAVGLVEADGRHGVQQENLEAIVHWMRRWLLGKDDFVHIADIEPLSEKELQCTERGQVLTMPNEKSVFDLNAAIDRQLADERKKMWNGPRDKALAAVRKTAGVRPLSEIGKLADKEVGQIKRDGYHIDKLVLTTADGLPIPVLTYHPPEPVDDAYLYVHDRGKEAHGGEGGPIESLVQKGHVVVAVDLPGVGEMAPDNRDELLGDWKSYYLAYLLGESFAGIRAEQIMACGRWVAHYKTDEPRRVHLVGIGEMAVPALHAAALEKDLFAELEMRPAPASWSDVVRQSAPKNQLTNAIHGALRVYDLPDLARSLDEDGNR